MTVAPVPRIPADGRIPLHPNPALRGLASASVPWSENLQNGFISARAPGHLAPDHKDGDPDKTKEEHDRDNHSDQENPNNDEYDK